LACPIKPFMMGAEPTGLDATTFAFVGGVLCPLFAGERYDNLKRYVGRMTARFYPDQGEIAGRSRAQRDV
jgi:glutathione S-transferase